MDKIIDWILKKLLIYKFKHQQLFAWSFGVDERADIDVLFEIDGVQGTRIPCRLMDDYHKWSKEKAPFNFNPCD